MSLITRALEILQGRVRLYLSIGGVPAVEIVIRDKEKEIVAEIKNPVLALELGVQQFAKGRNKRDSYVLKMIKAAGYKVKVKYKMLEFEV
jgi:hypothetical protein